MSETPVRSDWCVVHGVGAKVRRDAGSGSGVTWWECPQCLNAASSSAPAPLTAEERSAISERIERLPLDKDERTTYVAAAHATLNTPNLDVTAHETRLLKRLLRYEATVQRLEAERTKYLNMLCTYRDHMLIGDAAMLQNDVEEIDAALSSPPSQPGEEP